MNVAIVGYGVEGVASAKHWQALGAHVTICDQSEALELPSEYHRQLGTAYLNSLDQFDIIVRSAGIHPRLILAENPGVKDKITTSVQEFFEKCPSKNTIGVTGTKGKGTTSTLIAKMLEKSGKKVHLGGNIGIAPLELLPGIQADDYVVLELSSFQLEDFKGPSPHIAVCVMVAPEHLNWHADMDEYLAAKSQLFAHQSSDDTAIYFEDDEFSTAIAAHSPGKRIPYYQLPGALVDNDTITIDGTTICSVDDVALKGRHNWQNICAAVTAVWQVTKDQAAIASVISSFTGLEHRLELVRTLQGVSYYDDSFATTPETATAALEAFSEPKVVILGGSDKGVSLEPLAEAVTTNNVKHVLAIGDMGPVIADYLRQRNYTAITEGLTTMVDMVQAAQKLAKDGDVVLLSTGCASFGLFKDYKDRGNQFKAAVQALV
ncbi:MAG: UDP-N-acetylmuramoyl-L-alanine--D-glutamate ligase [Candidatus Saccharibacteria bacterium]|nr:UDP-N-acetylmuramoyl-L-alanine--D-glutamate ligase [Candidatus Saccharibacteria bacterium]